VACEALRCDPIRQELMTSEHSIPFLYTPNLEPGEEWLDVVLHFHSSAPEKADHTKPGPPITEKFELSPHIWIERLDASVAKQIAEACSPRNFDVPIHEQQGHTYAFVRKSRLPGLFHDFGGIEELGATIALSRLIRPTTMGLRWAARVSMVNGVVKQILAFQPRGIVVDAFCSKAIERDWLTQEDGDHLKRLMGYITTRESMHKRVHNAYWHHEYAIRTYYVDHRWVFVCTGLEALVHSSGTGTTGQFISRVAELAKREGINFTGDELATAYSLRSELVHGGQFLSDQQARLTAEQIDLYDRLEETLRRVLLKAFENRSFAANFADPASIDAFMPMPSARKRKH
jgi:hypothetical protein